MEENHGLNYFWLFFQRNAIGLTCKLRLHQNVFVVQLAIALTDFAAGFLSAYAMLGKA